MKNNNINKIDETLYFIEINENNNRIFYILSTETNTIDMKIILKNGLFTMYIKEGLEEYKQNKIKVTIKMLLLKEKKQIIPEKKKNLNITIHSKQKINNIEKQYLEYTMRSANIFQLSEIDKKYLQYFISHNNKQLDNNTLSFIYIILDKYLDTLTKLPNRGFFHKIINKNNEIIFDLSEEKIELKTINEGYLMFIDLNNLKAMNDIYGHNIADSFLFNFANLIKEKFKNIFFFRIGGDEFIAVSKNLQKLEQLSKYLHSLDFNNDIRKIIEEENNLIIIKELLFFASNGITTLSLQKENIKNIITLAEQKMYINKAFLHLEYGVYDRRTNGNGNIENTIIGKFNVKSINYIKNSKLFNVLSLDKQLKILTDLKKYNWEKTLLINDLKNKSENSENIKEKIKNYDKMITKLLNNI